jgi:hypothetical protein
MSNSARRLESASDSELDQPLSVYELGWVDLHVKHRPQVISGLCRIAGEVPIAIILERIQAFVRANTRYRCLLVSSSSPSWRLDPSFQVDNHVSIYELPDASIALTLEHIGTLLTSQNWADKPPWSVNVYRTSSSTEGVRTAIAFCAHHSLTDGLGARKLFEAILDVSEGGRGRDSEMANPSESRAKPQSTLSTLQFGLSLARDFSLKRYDDPFRGLPSSGRTVLELTCLREKLQHARKAFGCSLQELLLLVITRSLEKYTQRKGRFGKLRAVVPMADIMAARNDQGTAHHDIGYLDLPLNLRIDQQISCLRTGVSRLQQRLVDRVFVRLSNILARLPGLVRYHAAHRWSKNANLLISLVPGIVSRPTINGLDVTAIYGLPALAPGHAIAIGMFVSRDKVHVAVVLDPQSVPDHHLLGIDLENALSETLSQSHEKIANS